MAQLILHHDKISSPEEFMAICPFGALELGGDGKVQVNAACKMCKLCIKKGPPGAAEYREGERTVLDKSLWQGITAYVDHTDGIIHPVTWELIGEAQQLAAKTGQPTYCLVIGKDTGGLCTQLRHYGVDAIYSYDHDGLGHFRIEPYTAVFEDFAARVKPSVLLVGATATGRQLAPRVAARLRTGLTADCTMLDIRPDSDLVQIRPAFGGNIMAEIITPNHRPQLATVRYKVMEAAKRQDQPGGKVIRCEVRAPMLACRTEVLKVDKKKAETSIESADVLVVAGRGIRKKEDIEMLEQLAGALGGQVAGTRPVIEAGWLDAKRQVGLSGRTVRPKLIITCGVSGAIQFVAGMDHSDVIIAINKDANAPIFKAAHYGVAGDLYDIVPRLAGQILQGREEVPGWAMAK